MGIDEIYRGKKDKFLTVPSVPTWMRQISWS